MSPVNTILATVRTRAAGQLAAAAVAGKTSVASVGTKASASSSLPVDVSAYLKQNFNEPNYAAWGAAGARPSTPVEPGRNIFGELNPLTDVQEYMRLNGIEPNYSATTSAKSGSSPPAPTNPVRGSR